MNTLIDITSLHRINRLITAKDEPIQLADAVNLLHLIEHILFAERIHFVSFDNAPIEDETARAVIELRKLGCVSSSGTQNNLFISEIQGANTFEVYRDACDTAALVAADTFYYSLKREDITRMGSLLGSTVRPNNATLDDLNTVLSTSSGGNSSQDEADDDLGRNKADASVRYMLRTCETLRDTLNTLLFEAGPFSDGENEAIRVNLRMALNGELAKLGNARYSPMPKRAICDVFIQKGYRNKVAEILIDASRDIRDKKQLRNGLVQQCEEVEKLPLPYLAIHTLRKNKFGGALSMIEYAAEARDTEEISAVRKYLSTWEDADNRGDLATQNKVYRELNTLKRNIRENTGLDEPKSIVVSSIKILQKLINKGATEDEILSDLKIVSSKIRKRPAANFLSLVANDLGNEAHLRAWLIQSLNRKII